MHNISCTQQIFIDWLLCARHWLDIYWWKGHIDEKKKTKIPASMNLTFYSWCWGNISRSKIKSMLVVISSTEENMMEEGITGDGGWKSESIVFVIHCCVTNFPKTVSQSNHHLSSPVSWVRNPGWSGSTGSHATVKVSTGTNHLKPCMGEDSLPSSITWYLAGLVPLGQLDGGASVLH